MTKYHLPINYENESVDITQKCCYYLIENNYYQNNRQKNIKLLETFLINYSIIKLIEWNINLDELEIENWNNLNKILEILNNKIPTEKERDSFFNQYVYCILYIIAQNEKKDPIIWLKSKNISCAYHFIIEQNGDRKLITNEVLPTYQIPVWLIHEINSCYQLKNPTLKMN